MALLDTQCQSGNWVSKRVVEELAKLEDIASVRTLPDVEDANGNDVVPCGIISLQWLWNANSTRYYHSDFYVLAKDHFEIIFGDKYILDHGLLKRPKGVMLPLVAHKREDNREYLLVLFSFAHVC